MDIFESEKRSAIMAGIKCAGTSPELRLFALLREVLGGRLRVHQNVSRLPGRPDFVIPSLRVIVFMDGCFYHSCPKHGHNPKSNQEYWTPKLRRNQRRDIAKRKKLRSMGYSVWRFWEHDLKKTNAERVYERIVRIVAKARDRQGQSAPRPLIPRQF